MDATPIRPEAHGALSLAERHERAAAGIRIPWTTDWRRRWSARHRKARHEAKARKLRDRARRLGWSG